MRLRDDDQRLKRLQLLKLQVAQELVREREETGLSQGAFAKRLGIPQGDLSAIEHGKLARRFTLDRLCWLLCKLGHDVKIQVC